MPHVLPRAAFFRLAGRLARQSHSSAPPRRILVVKPDHMGDVLLASPALHSLRLMYPKAVVTLAVGPRGEDVARRMLDVDRIVVLPFPGLDPAMQPGVAARWSLLVHVARQWQGCYDAGLLLRDDYYWGALLMAAARIGRRAGTATSLCAPFLTTAIAPLPHEPAAAQHLRVVAALSGVAGDSPVWSPAQALRFAPQQSVAPARQRLAAGLAPGEPYLLLHPGSGAAVKLWTAEHWAAVLLELRSRLGMRTLVAAGHNEQSLVAPILRHAGGSAIGLASAPDIDLLSALILGARLVLGVDSGPLHLAAALDVPSVRLYGPVDPLVFGPWGDPRRHRSVASRMLCAPCDKLHWDTLDLPWHPCVRRLAPNAVVAASLAALEAAAPADAAVQVMPPGDVQLP